MKSGTTYTKEIYKYNCNVITLTNTQTKAIGLGIQEGVFVTKVDSKRFGKIGVINVKIEVLGEFI